MEKVNVICMKWGTVYGPEYVNKLYSMVKRCLHRPFRFVCFTDDASNLYEAIEVQPLPLLEVPPQHQQSPWRKLSMFQPQLANLTGMTLFLDLDLILVEDIDCFFSYGKPQDFCIIENWTQLGAGIGNSSVYRFQAGKCSFIYEAYNMNPLRACQSYDNEQIFLSHQVIRSGHNLVFWPKEWCRSFKRHALPKWPMSWLRQPSIPIDAKIVVFHGHPKPDEAALGRWPGKFWRRFRPATWIDEYWQ